MSQQSLKVRYPVRSFTRLAFRKHRNLYVNVGAFMGGVRPSHTINQYDRRRIPRDLSSRFALTPFHEGALLSEHLPIIGPVDSHSTHAKQDLSEGKKGSKAHLFASAS